MDHIIWLYYMGHIIWTIYYRRIENLITIRTDLDTFIHFELKWLLIEFFVYCF